MQLLQLQHLPASCSTGHMQPGLHSYQTWLY